MKPNNAIIINGVVHKLVKCRCKGYNADGVWNGCLKCSLWSICYSKHMYICDAFERGITFEYNFKQETLTKTK